MSLNNKVFIVKNNKGEIFGVFDTFDKALAVFEEQKFNMKEYYGETIDQEETFEDSYAVWTCEGEYEIVEIIVRIVR